MKKINSILKDQSLFFNLIEKELELSNDVLSKITFLEELEEWDSLAILTFVTLLDSKFKLNINTEQLNKCKKPTDLYLFVKKKLKLAGP